MRRPLDAVRSLNRYVALTLGDEWEVRLSTEKGVFNRPYARVIQIPSIEYIVESFWSTKIQSAYQIVAFPEVGLSADESQQNALDVADSIWVAFTGTGGVGFGHNSRIPLYDYAHIPMTGDAAFATEQDRKYNDFMKIEAPPNITPYPDPADELLWSVMANISMSWTRSAVVPLPGKTAASASVQYREDLTNG